MCQLGVNLVHTNVSARPEQRSPEPNDEILASDPSFELVSLLGTTSQHFTFFERQISIHELFMATSADPSQRPRLQFSQSFRTQATQDAIAQDPSLARTTDQQGSYLPESATAIASKLEGVAGKPNFESTPLSEDNLHHRLNASGSVQAIIVDDDVLFAGLQGGEIIVCRNSSSCPLGLFR